ncbi:MAG: twin-arginine translocation signal domain-containing protein [Burkholderiales bacterium]
MNTRRQFLAAAAVLAISGTAIAAEPPLATVYLNPG